MKLSNGTTDIILEIGYSLKRGKSPSGSFISKKSGRTLGYTTDTIRNIEKLKLIERKKKGHEKRINFTPNGWKAYNSLMELKEVGLE